MERGGTHAPEGAGPDAHEGDLAARRRALKWLSLSLGALIAAGAAVPFFGFWLAPLRRSTTPRWRPVGRADEFAPGRTVKVVFEDPDPVSWAGPVRRTAAWLRRDETGRFVAFSAYCTHVGCPVRWEEGARMFFCPCHGGVFHRDGAVAAGPPPRPLETHEVRIRGEMVEIRTRPVPSAG